MNSGKLYLILFVTLAASKSIIAQVTLQTGSAEASFPIYNYEDKVNRIGSGISINYVGGNGIKVNDYGQYIGVGWDLNFGGEIVRIQHGEPDDQKQEALFSYPNTVTSGTYSDYVNNYFPNGYLYSEFDPSLLVNNGGGYIPLLRPVQGAKYKQNPEYLADREQDEFGFTFNGRTGRFIIGKNGSIKTLVDSRLHIEKVILDMSSSNIVTRISEFHITDEMGIKYVFKDYEKSEVIQYEPFGQPFDPNSEITISYPWNSSVVSTYTLLKGVPQNRFVINKWLLSEIVNPLTNVKILFSYENYDYDMPGGKSGFISESTTKNDINLTVERIKGTAKRINEIQYSEKEKISFIYSSVNRKDLAFDKSLEQIHLKYDDEIKSKWLFNYGYFVKGVIKLPNEAFSQDEKYQSRMCLLSLTKTGKDGLVIEPPFRFDYFVGELPVEYTSGQISTNNFEVSPLNSFYTDHWGYSMFSNYFGFNNPYLSEPREDITKNNIPWQTVANITRNVTYSAPYVNGVQPTIRDNIDPDYGASFATLAGTLRKITYPYGGSLTYEYERNFYKGTGMTTEIPVGGNRVKKTILYDGINHDHDIIKEYKYVQPNGESSGWGYETFQYQTSKDNTIYKCSGGTGVQIVKETASTIFTTYYKTLLSGRNTATLFKPGSVSSPGNLLCNIVISLIIQSFLPDHQTFNISNFSTSSTIAGNSLPFMYSRVEVIDKLLTGNNGKVISEFTSISDPGFEIDVPVLPVANSARPRYAYWAYGLPKRISVFDNTNVEKTRTEYTYNLFKTSAIDNSNVSQKWLPNNMLYKCDLFYSNSTQHDGIVSDIYYPMVGRAEISQLKKYEFNDNSDYSLTTTNFYYNPDNFLPNDIRTTNSKGETIDRYTYYPEDYNLSGPIQNMKNNNILNVPISSQIIITKSGGQKYIMGGSVSEYGTLANGDIKITKTYTFRNDNPVSASLVSFSNSQLLPNTTYYKETGSIDYDINGATVQVNSEQGKVSNIYDYENHLPIAMADNAAFDDIAYTSFETENLGNWVIASGSIDDEKSITGERSFSGTLTKTLSHPGSYTVTLWSFASGNVSVNNQEGTLVTTIGDWKLYEWKFDNPGSIQIVADEVDEVRLYPSSAKMRTTTFSPLVGKTSECDASNRITYYEYDELGRLILIKDENRNIIKKICYNYGSQPENCCVNDEPGWQNTTTPTQCEQINGCTTGYILQEQKDINPCSPSYNNLRWVPSGYNPSACPSSGVIISYTNNAHTAGFTATYTLISNPNIFYTFPVPTSGSGTLGCIPSGKYTLVISRTPPGGIQDLLLFGNGCSYVSGTNSATIVTTVGNTGTFGRCTIVSIEYDF